MYIKDEDLNGKTVLEVGCGLGRTTLELASQLSAVPSAELIVTDITDRNFNQIKSSIANTNVTSQFIQTDACVLLGIKPASIDYIVCNFALCEINSEIGQGTLALAKILSVLKRGGKIFLEEEFPISESNGPAQQSWSLIWRILKSAFVLVNQKPPTNEYHPHVLEQILEVIGFSDIKWEPSVRDGGSGWIDIRLKILENIMPGFHSPQVGKMFSYLANEVKTKSIGIGRVEIPIYSISATKP